MIPTAALVVLALVHWATRYQDHPHGVMGDAVQPLNQDGSAVALAIQLAGHHLDLYFPTEGDPETVKAARLTEEKMIRMWCQKHYDDAAAQLLLRSGEQVSNTV